MASGINDKKKELLKKYNGNKRNLSHTIGLLLERETVKLSVMGAEKSEVFSKYLCLVFRTKLDDIHSSH